MAAILFLLLAWLSGTLLLQRTIGPFEFLNGPEKTLRLAGLWAAGLWAGLLPVTVMTYFLAALSARFFQQTYPLLLANVITLAELVLLLAFTSWPRWRSARRGWRKTIPLRQILSVQNWPAGTALTLGLAAASLALGSFLMWDSFVIEEGQLAAGYSIFGDFAPHTALVRSFAVGWNWPTGYPHFAGDGIHYHFLFYFLCGNLHYLGLPIDWAINLPSILSVMSVVILLALLARAITHQILAAILAPVLFFFRSSLALPLEIARQWQIDSEAVADVSVLARLGRVTQTLWELDHFIGTTPHDDWGLWTLNVYINQRHFLSGLAVLILLVLLLLPDLAKPASRWRTPVLDFMRTPSLWFSETKAELKSMCARQLVASLLFVCLPFWHGSVLVASLLILLTWWLFLSRRLVWTLAGLLALVSAVIQIRVFAGPGSEHSAVSIQWFWGFIAQDKSWAGIMLYLFLVTGLALPVGWVTALDLGRRARLLMAASTSLILFLFAISLTVDVTANHKFLMIALLLVSVPLAGALARLFKRRSVSALLLALVLTVVLTGTGLYETRLIHTINRNRLALSLESPVVHWILEQTPPRSIFLTAPYHYHAFFYSGRQAYYGHAYYAWSAGHDTAFRDALVKTLLASTEEDWPEVIELLEKQKIDYLLVDDELRNHPDFRVNESFFTAHFERAAEFPEQENTVIYDLRKRRDLS
ncbi:MAG: hypothetical protein PHQ83_05630 [Eubacteriales bacterium]|nr:hypothetical protein [Eubacteriales bacterium]